MKIKQFTFILMVTIIGFLLGTYIVAGKVWPYDAVNELYRYLKIDPEINLSPWQKLQNDLDLKPNRQLVTLGSAVADNNHIELDIPNLKPRREKPVLFIDSKAERGYRVFYGIFDFDSALHGAVLIGPDGEYIHSWQVTETGLDWPHQPDTNLFPHGFDIQPDGSVLFTFAGSSALQKIDVCSDSLWATQGAFHHAITAADDEYVWAMNGDSISQVSIATGHVATQFSLRKIEKQNPGLDIFRIRQHDSLDKSTWAHDPFHLNDVDPLTSDLESYYPGFVAGDLLVSLRNINLVFVVNSKSLKIKWWRFGPWRRQHDPDWNALGSFTVFDNNMHREISRIIEIDPASYQYTFPVRGEEEAFYSWVQGKHQMTPNGNILVTSAQQARVFEVTPDGEIVFEILNRYDSDKDEGLIISEGRWLPLDYFDEGIFNRCAD